MPDLERSLRLSQTITPFGVGAIYDVLGESFVACDTNMWKGHGVKLNAQRLVQKLPGISALKMAPHTASMFGGSTYGVPFFRFPQWMFCGSCRRMTRWKYTDEEEGKPATCSHCAKPRKLIPMRFVMVCEQGHMEDVPWDWYAHAGAQPHEQKQCQKRDMEFVTSGAGGGLGSLLVRCRTCKASRNLQGITAEGSMKRIGASCGGRQPWQSAQGRTCDTTPRVVQRGGSNVWFARPDSAIDIPPYSNYEAYSDQTLTIANTPEFSILLTSPTGPLAENLKIKIATDLDVTVQDVDVVLQAEVAGEDLPGAVVPEFVADTGDLETDLLEEEWWALTDPPTESDHRDHFVADRAGAGDHPPGPGADLAGRLAGVVLVHRLREVRALSGFSRVTPGVTTVKPDLGAGLDWLPAIEIFGEGIFLSLEEEALSAWEERSDVRARAQVIEQRRSASFFEGMLSQPATPRRIMLHTLAHLLMRQLSFESGYSSAALRERLYTHNTGDGEQRAGILVYTAAGDVEGTLGGLVRLGEPPHLVETLLAALRAGAWCSSDPVCGEAPAQGLEGMNMAACHACALVAETSCIQMNSLLDRGLVTGTPEHDVGFFGSVVDEALDAAVRTRA